MSEVVYLGRDAWGQVCWGTDPVPETVLTIEGGEHPNEYPHGPGGLLVEYWVVLVRLTLAVGGEELGDVDEVLPSLPGGAKP